MDSLRQDLRYAFRALCKRPAPTAVAVITLAVGIAATASLFSVIKGLVLDPLPYPQPDRLAQIWTKNVDELFDYRPLSTPDYLDLRERVSDLAEFGAFTIRRFNVGGDEPVSVEGAACTAGVFRALDVPPLYGRWFSAEDERSGAPSVILSYRLWKERFSSDPGCIGRRIRLDGVSRTVIGVMPEDFALLSAWTRNRRLDLWTPLPLARGEDGRKDYWMASIARLKEGATFSGLTEELKAAAAAIANDAPDADPRTSFWAMPLARELGGMPALRISILLAAGWTLFVLAANNVAGMLLARGISRRPEIAVRAALGAGRRRIIQLVLAESLLLSALAAGLGFLLTLWGVDALAAILPADVLPRAGLGIDGWLLGSILFLALVSTQMAGLSPALLASRIDVVSGLKAAGARLGGTRKAQRKLRSLVVGETAMALLLISAAVQLSGTYRDMLGSTGSLAGDEVVTAALAVKGPRYDQSAERVALWEGFLQEVASLPGVRDAAVTSKLPLEGGVSMAVLVDNEAYSAAESRPYVEVSYVSPDFFSAGGAALLQGRFLNRQDGTGARRRSVVINRAMARRYWPGKNPIGRRVRPAGEGTSWSAEVVGVIENIRQVAERPAKPEMYYCFSDAPSTEAFLVVRTAPGIPAPAGAIRRALARIDPNLALADIRTMESRIRENSRIFTVVTAMVDVLSLALLGLAALGIYGTLSFYFTQRRHEIGVRLALGAQPRDIRIFVFRRALIWVAAGAAIGTAGAWLLARGIGSVLQGASPFDVPHTAVSLAAVVATAVLGAWLPARRAARVDPKSMLRYE